MNIAGVNYKITVNLSIVLSRARKTIGHKKQSYFLLLGGVVRNVLITNGNNLFGGYIQSEKKMSVLMNLACLSHI